MGAYFDSEVSTSIRVPPLKSIPKFRPLKEYIRTEQIISANERIKAGFLNERNLILLLVANEKILIFFYNFSSFSFLLLI